ncbi:unnamed protein product [Linum trigynum]|uniref:DELLA protein n=1 Tax=Linum trigynum TaxID=586398 RepID=A0AAV2FSH2_9ROSI
MASMLGRPLWFDQSTRLGRRMGFPKVCVEMSIDSPFPETLKLAPDHKPAFVVNLEYFNKPIGSQKCKVFGHKCEDAGCELEEGQGSQGNAEAGEVEAVTGSAGQVILESILTSRGKAQESAESACQILNLAVANLVKSIEQGVLTEWQKTSALELPTDSELQTAMVGQTCSPTAEEGGPITPVANRFQSLAGESLQWEKL